MKKNESIREYILNAAREAVCTDRNRMYGEPEDSFGTIADLWCCYVEKCCVIDGCIVLGSREVAEMMILFKMARLMTSTKPNLDSYADIAGYAACAGEVVSGGAFHE